MRRSESGISLIVFAILLPVILIAVIVAINLAWLAIARSQAQSAVDAAALSAAGGIVKYQTTGSPDRIEELMELFNGVQGGDTNDIIGEDPAISYSRDATLYHFDSETEALTAHPSAPMTNAVGVTRTIDVPLFLTNMLGLDDREVRVSAVALLDAPRCAVPTIPVTLAMCEGVADSPDCETSTCDMPFSITKMSSSQVDNGAFYAECPPEANNGNSDNSSCDEQASAKYCKDRVSDPSIPGRLLCTGSLITLTNGQVTSCLHEMSAVLSAHRSASPPEPWIVTVPIVDCKDFASQSFNFTQQAPVRGFAAIEITKIENTGSDKKIDFIKRCSKVQVGAPSGGKLCGLLAQPTLIR